MTEEERPPRPTVPPATADLTRRRFLGGAAVVGGLAAGWSTGPARTALAAAPVPAAPAAGGPRTAVHAAGTARRFTVAVVPDTQYLFDGEQDRVDAQPLVENFQWLIDNADERNIMFTASLGDLTEHGTAFEMERVGPVYDLLGAAGMSYSALAGNHDVNGRLTDAQRPGTPYLAWFGPDRVGGQSTFGGADTTGYNTFHVFSGGGREWLLLALDWRMSEASYGWAQRVIDEHSELPVILTTHELVGDLGGGVAGLSGYGQTVWDRLITGNDQVFMALGGHYWPTARTTMRNAAGHDVELELVNYQEKYYGGAGMIRLYTLDLDEGTIDVESFSPWARRMADEGNPLAHNVARPTREGDRAVDQFSRRVDFEERFASFTPVPVFRAPAAPVEDSLVSGTVAYWRLGDPGGSRTQDGRPVASRSLRDLSGNGNDLRLVRLSGADRQSVAYSDADDPDQPGSGSLQFTGAQRGSYLRTVAGAPMDDATFTDGYTLEAFVRLPEQCCGGDQAWMGVLSRLATGADAGKSGGWNRLAPAATLSFSPSRQVQWELYPTNLDGTLTNWSYELETQVWRHVAVVNDGSRTTLYIDGAPIVRSPKVESVGIAGDGNSWLVGASSFNGVVDKAFSGWLGDIRIVDRALAPQEWLTARTP